MSDERTDGAAEVLWDSWGVPHVYAESETAGFRAFGWAQARAHARLLVRLYALARGEAAATWGERYAESDRFVRRAGIPARAAAWEALQEPDMRACLDAFVEGVNAALNAHPDALDDVSRTLPPVTVRDVLCHIQRVYLVYLTQLGQRPAGMPYNDLIPYSTLLPDIPTMGTGVAGSNAWAVAGSRTAGGHGLLLANPHLYWGDFHTFFEAHLNTPELDLYGVAQVGWPVLRYGFNSDLGWAHTVNTLKGWDAFALVERDGGYVLDGVVRPFETHEETLRIREDDGGVREETLVVRRTEHGPVLAEHGGRPIAVRCVGLDVSPISGIFAQYRAMGRARTHAEFEAALARGQNAMFTVMYADREGNAAQYFTGLVPRRRGGTWQDVAGTLPGDDSSLIWTQTHDFSALPRVVNPPSGWVQNANNPPWLTTLPVALNPDDFPAYLAPRMVTPREQRSLRMLSALDGRTISADDLLAAANDVRSETADRLLGPLLEAVAAHGDDSAREAAAVLEAWDRRYAADSVGADLFARWLVLMTPDRELRGVTAEPWSAHRPLDTPAGLADPVRAAGALSRAARSLLEGAGILSRPWGDVTRAARGEHVTRGHGHLDPFGVFRVSGFVRGEDGVFDTVFGTTFVAAVEFTSPVRARVLLSYGNSSQPGSPHAGDQLDLLARGEYREAWLTRAEVEAHLARREEVGPGAPHVPPPVRTSS